MCAINIRVYITLVLPGWVRLLQMHVGLVFILVHKYLCTVQCLLSCTFSRRLQVQPCSCHS